MTLRGLGGRVDQESAPTSPTWPSGRSFVARRKPNQLDSYLAAAAAAADWRRYVWTAIYKRARNINTRPDNSKNGHRAVQVDNAEKTRNVEI